MLPATQGQSLLRRKIRGAAGRPCVPSDRRVLPGLVRFGAEVRRARDRGLRRLLDRDYAACLLAATIFPDFIIVYQNEKRQTQAGRGVRYG